MLTLYKGLIRPCMNGGGDGEVDKVEERYDKQSHFIGCTMTGRAWVGMMSHRHRKISLGTSLDIAAQLDMSMEGPPPTLGVNIHLQTPTKVGTRRPAGTIGGATAVPPAPTPTPGREDRFLSQVSKQRISVISLFAARLVDTYQR
ncbi:hypothetical protein E2C01_048482 [Portunus trituberculatus]|uniref:Uncharacterized protein n=1 Tax=Portunus trituberculatus TaxID=210409 RepID=A0A5B7G3Y3_PORTR|nr:hypothetical protein [Portunus trituberculatus]